MIILLLACWILLLLRWHSMFAPAHSSWDPSKSQVTNQLSWVSSSKNHFQLESFCETFKVLLTFLCYRIETLDIMLEAASVCSKTYKVSTAKKRFSLTVIKLSSARERGKRVNLAGFKTRKKCQTLVVNMLCVQFILMVISQLFHMAAIIWVRNIIPVLLILVALPLFRLLPHEAPFKTKEIFYASLILLLRSIHGLNVARKYIDTMKAVRR